ncbi:MAG: aminotransferase [Betaproteobacteria bacterium RIFCSPLOWO2_02_FULL_67_26]|nr:MAG: aminotransferase [Betaproteobacteria bacterium RIFCSPLOWO2_02_FULL_67_26]
MFSGVFDLPWWGHVIVALVLTHVTIIAVTVFLHRHQAHRALDLHPAVSHCFRLWLWLTTGMVTREWAAIHRKHHAKVETPEDPHSPQVLGINRVLWGGVILYVKETRNRATIERYGHGAPDDWLERHVYSRYLKLGLTLMGFTDVVLFGIVPGVLIFLTQIAWIPFWAAGVINGIGHYWGYRNSSTPDASTNIVPWGILIGGEELHNNHHAYTTSARLSSRWYEFDIGWMYIRMLEALGLATVKRVAPVPRFAAPRLIPNLQMLQAVITHRYDVLAKYAKSLQRIGADGQDAHALQTMHAMRHELIALWERSTASKEQLVRRLQDWCQRAEASGIRPLVEFSQKLRCYA